MVKIFSRKSFLLSLAVSSTLAVAAYYAPTFLVAGHDLNNALHTVSVSTSATPEQVIHTDVKAARHNERSNLRNIADGRWKAGVTAFGQADMKTAAENFRAILTKDDAKLSPSDRAAVAFWAYRALSAAGDADAAKIYLEQAANADTSFYSILARRINGGATVSPNVQMSMAIEYATHKEDVSNLYPLPNWAPTSGYSIQPALLFAIMRQESAFNPHAQSASGAVGVMQLMPDTAHAMARNVRVHGSIGEPAVSMALGQQYVKHLMEDNAIGDNLVYLLAAYNAGPGAVEKWQTASNSNYKDDPLLFVESIPYAATRDYVVNVIGNYWVYSELFGDANFSLSMIAQGEWPLYTSSLRQVASSKTLMGTN